LQNTGTKIKELGKLGFTTLLSIYQFTSNSHYDLEDLKTNAKNMASRLT